MAETFTLSELVILAAPVRELGLHEHAVTPAGLKVEQHAERSKRFSLPLPRRTETP